MLIQNAKTFISFSFPSEKIGWIVNNNGEIYKTTDSGQT